MKDKLATFLPFCLAALLIIVNACDSRADAVPPAPRLARQLPPEAAARAAARREHNEALRLLFRAAGVTGANDTRSVKARAAAISAVIDAISNRAEVASGVTADRVAAAVAALTASATNATSQTTKEGP